MRSWLLLLPLCYFFLPVDGFGRCSAGQSCVEVNSCCDPPRPPFRRCAFHPSRVCCTPKKERMQKQETPPLNPNPGKCGRAFGKPSLEGLIVGGKKAEKGKWPWMVSILRKDKKQAICTGFLIDHRHVLTAAHCFERTPHPGVYVVRAGGSQLYTGGKEVSVSRLLLHPSYRRDIYYNDVALLTLALDLPKAHPVCLPSSRSSVTARAATVVGWGATDTNGGPMSKSLQELGSLPLVAPSNCELYLRDHLRHSFKDILPRGVDASLLCAGAQPEKDTCNGDSGAPLMVQEGGRWFAVGVVAFGSNKCGVGVPGVYSSVAYYLPWILDNKE